MNKEIKYSTNHTSISTNTYTNRNYKLDLGELVYNKTFEEEMEEERKIGLAISHLERLGVEVVSEYGHYRNIYNVLKDLGECLNKKNKIKNSDGELYVD